MTIIEMTRAQADAERRQILQSLWHRYGTDNRADLREISVSGEMALADVAQVDELLGLDFLLRGE